MEPTTPHPMDDDSLPPEDAVEQDVVLEDDSAATSVPLSPNIAELIAEPLRVTFDAVSCHFAGRGAAALLALIQAIPVSSGEEIIMPSLVCPSVPLACIKGGLVPVFADVLREDYTLDPAAVAACINERTVAIIAVHLFGHPCDLSSLRALSDRHGLLLIEDCAQSIGQFDGDDFCGTVGDATILSFHPSKILPAAGGGVVLLRNGARELADRVRQALAAMPEESVLDDATTQDLVRRGNAILNAARLDPDYAARYRSLIGELSQGIPMQISIPQLQGIAREWETLDQVVVRRELRARRYEALLAEPLLIHPRLRGAAKPLFRYTLRPDVTGEAGNHATWHLTAALRHFGHHASNLYFPVHRLLGEEGDCPVAEAVGPQLVNLWLDGSATAQTMLDAREVLGYVLHRTNFCAAPVPV